MIGWRSLHLSLWHFCWFLWLFHYVVCECFFYSIFSLGNVAFLLLLALRSFYRPHAKLCTPSVSFYSEYELVSSQTLQCLNNFYMKKINTKLTSLDPLWNKFVILYLFGIVDLDIFPINIFKLYKIWLRINIINGVKTTEGEHICLSKSISLFYR